MKPKIWIMTAAVLGASGVALGAYHAHGLEKSLDGRYESQEDVRRELDNFGVGVRYHMFHALAILGVGLLALHGRSAALNVAASLQLAGVVCFSGGLYLPVISGQSIPWFIVPVGGLMLIGGWLALAFAAARR